MKNQLFSRAGATGLVTGVALCATPALAHGAAPTTAPPSNDAVGGVIVSPVGGHSISTVTVTLPRDAQCASPTDDEGLALGQILAGAGGDFEQQGQTYAEAAATMACTADASPQYTFGSGVLGPGDYFHSSATLPASPGDRIVSTIQYLDGNLTATTTDATTRQSETITQPYGQSIDGATQLYEGAMPYLGILGNCTGTYPNLTCAYDIPVFRSIGFSAATLDGVPLGQTGAASRVSLNQDGPVQLVPQGPGTVHPRQFQLIEHSDQ